MGVRFHYVSYRISGWSFKCFCIGFKHQRCGPYQPRPAALVLRTKKKKPYLIFPHLSAPGPKGPGAERWGMVIVYFLLAYEYLGRCPRLVWVGPLALKADRIEYSHPEIRHEPSLFGIVCQMGPFFMTASIQDLRGSGIGSRDCRRRGWLRPGRVYGLADRRSFAPRCRGRSGDRRKRDSSGRSGAIGR